MNHISLFSGIGGIDLAAEWAGFTTTAFCENDPYCQRILNLRWPGVPICEDIREMGKEWIDERGIATVVLISGGFPCQPFSVAGKRRGKEDDRYLWPEMLRVIREIRPRWALGENVVGFIHMGLDEALSDLEGLGYETQAFVIPACAAGAPHLRERVFFVAHDTKHGRSARWPEPTGQLGETGVNRSGQDVAHTDISREHQCGSACNLEGQFSENCEQPRNGWAGEDNGHCGRPAQSRLGRVADGFSAWLDEPGDVPRVATGVENRANRLKCLGNAVVPQQVYPILAAMAAVELEMEEG